MYSEYIHKQNLCQDWVDGPLGV